MATLEKAIALAATAHQGQVDKAGSPYILHPIRVMMSVATPEQRIAAILHDIVEDTAITLDDLRSAGFTDDIVDAVDALTKTSGETRFDAAQRAVANSITRQVKLADVADNMDMRRIPSPTARDFERLEEYKRVRELLTRGPAD